MEDKVFPRPAVAGLMNKHLVELRLHVDAQNTLTAEQFAENKRLQAELAGTLAMPYFVVVDPTTGKTVDIFEMSGEKSVWTERWVAFLNDLAKKTGRT